MIIFESKFGNRVVIYMGGMTGRQLTCTCALRVTNAEKNDQERLPEKEFIAHDGLDSELDLALAADSDPPSGNRACVSVVILTGQDVDASEMSRVM